MKVASMTQTTQRSNFASILLPWIVWIQLLNLVVAPTAAATNIPSLQIATDIHRHPVLLPLVGAGTWQYNDTVAYQSVCLALQNGYTLIDTAYGYKNQKGVGDAIKDCYQESRYDLFVLTKVPGGLTAEQTHAAHQQNLWELGLYYVDHLMVHFPSDWDQKNTGKKQRQEQWKALEEIYNSGQARSIGVSHYCVEHLNDILEVATVMPSLNQVEYHVGSQDIDHVIDFCTQHTIAFMSFSPLCGPCQLKSDDDSLIHGKLVANIAAKYPNKTGAQVALRFIVQQALAGKRADGTLVKIAGVIPKSHDVKHITQNRDLFDFELTAKDMQTLQSAKQPEAEAGDCDVP